MTSNAAAIDALGGRVETRFHDDINHAEIVGALSGPADFLAPVRADVVDFVWRPQGRSLATDRLLQQAAGGSDPHGQSIGE